MRWLQPGELQWRWWWLYWMQYETTSDEAGQCEFAFCFSNKRIEFRPPHIGCPTKQWVFISLFAQTDPESEHNEGQLHWFPPKQKLAARWASEVGLPQTPPERSKIRTTRKCPCMAYMHQPWRALTLGPGLICDRPEKGWVAEKLQKKVAGSAGLHEGLTESQHSMAGCISFYLPAAIGPKHPCGCCRKEFKSDRNSDSECRRLFSSNYMALFSRFSRHLLVKN